MLQILINALIKYIAAHPEDLEKLIAAALKALIDHLNTPST